MLEAFKSYIVKNKLFTKDESLIAAVSGGIDSMAMLNLLRESGYNISVAHCNFGLRGDESDGDQLLVEDYCRKHSISIDTRKFETRAFAESNGISIQMAARELRYDWFGELAEKRGSSAIAIAHNHDDIIETFFINLARGTGLKGLTGIKTRNEKIVRPLLFASREMITAYVDAGEIPFREDSSNNEIYYTRNLVRHRLIPLMEEINPSFRESAGATIKRLAEAESVLSGYFDSLRRALVKSEKDAYSISIDHLLSFKPRDIHIYEMLKQFGISSGQVDEVSKIIRSGPGSQRVTPTHIIYKDRHQLFIVEPGSLPLRTRVTDSPEVIDALPGFSCSVVDRKDFVIEDNPSVAALDLDKVKFPLTVRSWNDGDRFQPLGMKGMKKLSDLFADLKIPAHRKNTIRIFTSADDIIWVAGLRIDHRYRITDSTARVLLIRMV